MLFRSKPCLFSLTTAHKHYLSLNVCVSPPPLLKSTQADISFIYLFCAGVLGGLFVCLFVCLFRRHFYPKGKQLWKIHRVTNVCVSTADTTVHNVQ